MGGIQDFLVQQVKNAVMHHTDQQGTGFDPSALRISSANARFDVRPVLIRAGICSGFFATDHSTRPRAMPPSGALKPCEIYQ